MRGCGLDSSGRGCGSLPASYEGGNETSVSIDRKYFTTEKF
jgi:hypothetical protein